MFTKRLEHLRNDKELTHQEMANMLGVTRQAYGNYENGKRQPDHETLKKLAKFFNVSIDYLLANTDDRTPPTTDSNQAAIRTIEAALEDDSELYNFFAELKEREDLQILFKQVRPLDSDTVKRIIRYIKMVEDEESNF